MSKVFVLDTNKQPLNPIHPGYARLLLSSGKAAVFKRYPFTIILKYGVASPKLEHLRIKIDPGSKTTGIAIVNGTTGEIVFAAEPTHRGDTIKSRLDARRALRHVRRHRKTCYRQPRFLNRLNKRNWLPPSLESRIANTLTWTKRLVKLCPVEAISQELVKFDTQAMQHPEISGVEYQQGELAGYELREYLLEKWGRACVYCGAKEIPLQIEHIICRARAGTNRVSNLTLACNSCNLRKGTQRVEDFLKEKPAVLERLLAQAKVPLKDAAVVNTTRWALYKRLQSLGLPLECGTGGRTKYNRVKRNLPKAHWLDAACVGASTPEQIKVTGVVPLLIKATGHGSRQMCRMDRYGFPRTGPKQVKRVHGFQTGDIVKAVVTTSKKAGTYVGRVSVRVSGWFNITTASGSVQGISHQYCTPVYRSDGYFYQKGKGYCLPLPERLPCSVGDGNGQTVAGD